MDTARRIEYAKWVLERNIAWIAQAEVKVVAAITLNIALISSLAVTYTTVAGRSHWAIGFSCASGFLLLIGMAYAARTIFPDTENSNKSFVFFGRIVAGRTVAEFDSEFKSATDVALLTDLIDQVYRNASIANSKHFSVKRTIAFTLVGGALWIPAVLNLIKH